MSEDELDGLEAGLSRLRPASPPPDLLSRLMEARPEPVVRPVAQPRMTDAEGIRARLIRWLVPSIAAAAFALLAISVKLHSSRNSERLAAADRPMTADDVQINHELVGSFETVANLPGGEPVRLECKRWLDKVVYRDKATGDVIEQETPRLQVVPVGFETY
jgi:hypothetical protein